MQFFKKNYSLILVLFLCFWTVKPLFVSGFFPMHDNEQVARLFDLEQTLKSGNIPPRIAPNLGFGYGYPFFNFYPSFVYYVALIFRLVGFTYIDSTKLMIGIGVILSALFMYLFSKEIFGRKGGIISSVAYTFAPYHAVNIYVRGAFPEFWSFVFLPLIFLSYLKLSKKQDLKYFILAIISSSFLILTHNLVAFMASFFIFIWVIFLALLSSEKKRFVITFIVSVVFALGLTSFFWIPSYFEKQYTMINLLTSELANYKIHFVCVKQLFYSPWGYGASLPFCNDGLSFEVGKIQLLLSSVAIILGVYLYKLNRKTALIIFIFTFFLLASLFMTNSRSEFIWNLIKPMDYIQFPWRYLIFASFFSALLPGAINLVPVRRINILIVISVLFLIGTNIFYFHPEKYLSNISDVDYVSVEKIRWDTSKLAAEYAPLGIATKKTEINTTVIDINQNEIAKADFKVISGKIDAVQVVEKPQYKKFNLTVSNPGEFRINTYTFPGWKTYLDGKQIKYTDNNKLKLITIYVPEGKHILEAKLTDTNVRIIGNSISLFFLFVVFIGIIYPRKKKQNEETNS